MMLDFQLGPQDQMLYQNYLKYCSRLGIRGADEYTWWKVTYPIYTLHNINYEGATAKGESRRFL